MYAAYEALTARTDVLDMATAYAYYTNTQADVAACWQVTGVNQAGMPRMTTSASPEWIADAA